jgi:signal transduction histidine kinase/FixJ family two-component response regulator
MRASGITIYDTTNGLPHNRVQCVAESTAADGSKTVWAGTDKGIARLETGRWRVYTTADGLANDTVLGLQLDATEGRHVLWAGTFGGASRLDLDKSDARWETFTDTTTPALPNNTVYGIEQDHAGRLYLFTNKGIARLTRREPTADDPSDFSIYTFTTADGLPGNECDIGASMVDAAGRIWAGTVNGVAMLDPSHLPEDRSPKPLVVERVLVNDGPRPLPAGATLSYDENNVVFEFALLSYFRGDDTTFRTQLVGLDREPSAWSPDPKRVLSNLPAGDYTFEVWGRDYAGNVTGPIATPFRIRPAPWHTWWAYATYILLVAFAGYAFFRYRTEALRRRNEALEAKIRERTVELAEKVEQVRASEQRAVEASRAKSTFLASMSHELRTPLNAILGFVQLMERVPERSPEDREQLSIIARSGEHLLALINDVLSLSKIEAGQLTLNERSFDLPGLLRNVEELFRLRAHAKGLQLIVEVDPELPQFVTGDDGKLRQILINLLGNAFKFTETGGVALRAAWTGTACRFEVEDTDHGISKAELERLFEAFVQTASGRMSNEGTGLGLSISRSYVSLMGGDIRVSSEEGQGTRFTFDVPLTVADAPAMQAEELAVVGLEMNQPAYRVLVVDDKWENRKLLAKLLADVGCQVQEAATGKQALERWVAWRPEIVWMDIQMPEMDGYDATRRIRAIEEAEGATTRTCILAVTASAFAQDRQAILDAGCDDYVPKPFRNATIFAKMAEHAGVRFAYSRTGHVTAPAPVGSSAVTSDRLAALPEDIVDRLNRAVVQGDVEQAMFVADEIVEFDAQLGEELRGLVRSYRFDDILERVGRG